MEFDLPVGLGANLTRTDFFDSLHSFNGLDCFVEHHRIRIVFVCCFTRNFIGFIGNIIVFVIYIEGKKSFDKQNLIETRKHHAIIRTNLEILF